MSNMSAKLLFLYCDELREHLEQAYLLAELLKPHKQELSASQRAQLRNCIYFCNSIANILQEILARE
ncbi:hypothetical protein DRH29_05040 [candidate division Kazan bacterium]|uniref:Four helix bundle protein n=1 Tax=candidate division Kazan bacterium TaxID=2202143 RepID=A0A420ZBE0_UNCK3|nr:MAG: hypothetical protein DRH29_05040 [candidate division Kazan bacterium]